MHEDKQGNLWLVTGGGLVKFVASAEQIQYPSEHIAFNMHFSEGVGATDGRQIFLVLTEVCSILPLRISIKQILYHKYFLFYLGKQSGTDSQKTPSICLLILMIAGICSYLLIIIPSDWYFLL